MKKRTPRALASDLLKVRLRIIKAHDALESAKSLLAYTAERHGQLPADLDEAAADLREAASNAIMARADLTKPLEKYTYDQDWRSRRHEWGRRRYASPIAQKAYDADRREHYARERYENLKNKSAIPLYKYIEDAKRDVEIAESEFNTLTAIRDNLVECFKAIMGHEPSYEECAALAKSKKEPKETPDHVDVTARALVYEIEREMEGHHE